jgi:hypothetical protein
MNVFYKIIKQVSLKKFLELIIIVIVLLTVLINANQIARKIFVKGHGIRMGVVTKITERGWFVKSWEGQLFVPSEEVNYASGALDPDVWDFSVTDTNVVKDIQSLMGKNVLVLYKRGFNANQETIFDVISITTNNVPQVFIKLQDPMEPFPKFVQPQH